MLSSVLTDVMQMLPSAVNSHIKKAISISTCLWKNLYITFFESAVGNHKTNGHWENVTGEMWMCRNGYFAQLLTEIGECETLKEKRRKELEEEKKSVNTVNNL